MFKNYLYMKTLIYNAQFNGYYYYFYYSKWNTVLLCVLQSTDDKEAKFNNEKNTVLHSNLDLQSSAQQSCEKMRP